MNAARVAQRATAVIAVLLMGLMAGFFFAFAVDVAPAFTHLDARGYTEAQQWINRVVRNAGFGSVYFGAVAAGFAASAAAWVAGQPRLALAWLAIAAVWFVAVFWITRSINVPINEALALWNPAAPPPEWQAARDRWNQANLWRAWASALCFALALALAVFEPGHSEAAQRRPA